jgi:hypothetical protein
MEYSNAQIKDFIKKVVAETVRGAREETGYLKRSIRGVWFNGIVTFREIYYGAYNDNAQLVENAKAIMPSDIPWEVIFVDEEGREQKLEGRTRQGRKISRRAITNRNVSTTRVKTLINSLRDGQKKDDRAEGDREQDTD